jgi:hypothetical protein
MGTVVCRRAIPQVVSKPANGSSAGFFVGGNSALDRELAELERRGLARLGEGGTVAITRRGLEELQLRFPRRRR